MTESLSNAMNSTQNNLKKVPEITVLFWIIKVLTTGTGEAISDYISHGFLGDNGAMILFGVFLVISLGLQFKARRYVTWIYWLNITLISIFGTMVADCLRFGPVLSVIIYAVLLATILITWYLCEKTLSVHSIYTRRRETFYWLTILITFALGTAAGDMTADVMKLGYVISGFMFIGIIAIPPIAYWKFGMNEIFAFWFAYIITRPLGASFADWLIAPSFRGGLELNQTVVSLVLIGFIIALVTYMGVNHIDTKGRNTAETHPQIAS
jgi:uncharacterized membrane-anchored protein